MAKKTAAVVAPAGKTITVDEAEFIRTRDALVVSWTSLHGALQQAIQAYIEHSNAVLGGEHTLDNRALQQLLNAASQLGSTPIQFTTPGDGIKNEGEPSGKKPRRKREREERPPGYPKQPMTGYLLYLHKNRPQIQAELDAAHNGETQPRGAISAEGTRRWKTQMTEGEKKSYCDTYRVNFEVYKERVRKFRAENGMPELPRDALQHKPDDDATAPEDEEEHEEAEAAVAGGSPQAGPSHPTEPPASARRAKPAAKLATPTPEPPEQDVHAGDTSSVVSSTSEDEDGDDESEAEPEKEPTPPPPPKVEEKPKKKPGRPVGSKNTKKAEAIDQSAAALTSSQPAAAAATAGPPSAKKRKSAAVEEEKKEPPKSVKKTKKAAAAAEKEGPKSTPEVVQSQEAVAETPKTEKKKRERKRKSAAAPADE